MPRPRTPQERVRRLRFAVARLRAKVLPAVLKK